VAEEALNATAKDTLRTEILLMGCPGYSTENQVGLLKGMGLDLEPDLAVLAFFVGNDVTGIPIRGKIIRGKKYYTGSPIWWLHALRQSHLFMLAESLFVREIKLAWLRQKNQRQRERLAARTGDQAAGLAADPPVSPLYLEIMKNNFPVYRREPNRRLRNLWRDAERYLGEFHQVCQEAGIPWLLLIIPGEEQVDPKVRQEVLEGLKLDPADFDFDLPQRRLVQFATLHGIPVLDPLPRLRALHQRDARLYVPNDTHWSVRGNEVVGRMLADAILAMKTAAYASAQE
jgi:hypothetical protein